MTQRADFKSATAGQLLVIGTYLDKADSMTLDLLWDWTEGIWEPAAVTIPPIEWLISWLDMHEHKNGR